MNRKRIVGIVAILGTGMLLALTQKHPTSISLLSSRERATVRELVFSDQAQRFLILQYRSYPTEFMGCMIGDVRNDTVRVARIAPADVEPARSAATHVNPEQTCESAGWSGTVGIIHSHPGGESCWYYFPGTRVMTSDVQSFINQSYPVDAIMCGDRRVVWISREDMKQREIIFLNKTKTPVIKPTLGNKVQ